MTTIDLSNFFKTKTEANDFLQRLSLISAMIYETNFQLDQALATHFGLEKKDKMLILLHEEKVDVTSPTLLKAFFDKLTKDTTSLPLLPLTLAFEPNEQTLKILSDWFLLNVQKQVLFDISIDRRLIAGAALTFNGSYKDYSIKATFEKIVTNNIGNQNTLPETSLRAIAKQSL